MEFKVYDFGAKYPHGPFKSDYTPPPKPKKIVKQTNNYCSCVLTAKAWTGYSRSIGVARNWERNSDVPVIGGVLIENLTNAGHVSMIIGLTNEGIVVKEGNYKRCSLTEGRVVPYDSPTIIGFWSP